jgi:hypothetical protein
MPSSYSTNLKIELQATGENSGTWGTITNTNLGTALEQAVVGYGNPSYPSDANLTLTYTDTNAAQAARALVLNVTSAVSLSTTRELVVPTIQKQYIVQNNTTGGQSITVKTSAGTGITVPNGRKAHLYVNGTDVIYMDDFVDINGGTIDGTTIGGSSAAAGTFTTLTASSIATFAAGTAAAPSITTTGDTNTGLFFPAADTIAFTEGGTESFRVNSSGQVGIGTASPAIRLQVSDVDQATARIGINNANGQNYQFVAGNPGASNTGFAIFDATASATRLYLDSSGNVGIGTSSPTEKLHVAGALRVTGAQTTAGTGVYLDQTSGTGGVSVYGPDNSTQGTFRIYTATANGGTGSTKLTLDTSGNLGLGVTPSVWGGGFKAIQMTAGASFGSHPTVPLAYVNANTFFDGSVNKYISSAFASRFISDGNAGGFGWQVAASGTAGNTISFTQAMTLDASGNLGLGATTTVGGRLVITQSNATQPAIYLPTDESTIQGPGTDTQIKMGGNLILQSSSQTTISAKNASGLIVFQTGSTPTERARITSGGDLLVGTTAARAGELVSITKNMTTNWLLETVNTATSGNIFGNLVLFTGQSPNNATSKFMAGSDNTTERFALRSNGGLANYQANDANLSDERVKTDIKPLGSYWDKFKAIEIVAFKYKDQTHDDDNIGVIAQQVESVAPEFVDADGWGETPEDGLPLKTVYTTDMYHAAIKALQEAMTRIEQLEAKFAALETK